VSPRVKLKADCASDVGGNVITVHKDCRLCCVSLAFNMPAGWYAMLVVRLTVELPQELYSCLEEEASRRQTSKAEVIRELLSKACKGGEKK